METQGGQARWQLEVPLPSHTTAPMPPPVDLCRLLTCTAIPNHTVPQLGGRIPS